MKRNRHRTLSGKRIVITGASSGIGKELAVQLAEQGAPLLLVARNEERLLQLRDELLPRGQQSPSVVVVCGDITSAITRGQIVESAREKWNGLDVLINNAGISAHGRFEDASPERLRQIMEVNFFAPTELARACLPLLTEGNQPAVVNVGSILGRRGVPFNNEYCASKFALTGWSEAVRPELARKGIDVILVNPGTTDTPFFDHLIEKTGDIPWRQSKGTPSAKVARQILKALERRKKEIVIGRSGKTLLWLNRLAPQQVSRWLQRYG